MSGRIKCKKCGKEFEVGNRPDGLPNGVGFEMEDGSIINICTECIIKNGEEGYENENN